VEETESTSVVHHRLLFVLGCANLCSLFDDYICWMVMPNMQVSFEDNTA